MNLSIYGTSEIINHHIKAARANTFKIISICTSNKKSRNIDKLCKKFKIKETYYNYKTFAKNAYLKNSSVLIAGRIKDNKKVLKECLKYNLRIIIEKPIFINKDDFNLFRKFNKNIFVAYNRIYYESVNKLKTLYKNEKPQSIIINCPETNLKNILLNSCHLISIIYYIFGKIRLQYKIKNKKSIVCIFKSHKNIPIIFNLNLGSPDNFAIEINFKKIRARLCPIETLKIYRKLKKKKYKGNNLYIPEYSKIIDEYKISNFKPGFKKQYLNFKNFLNHKKNINNDLLDAKEIISICKKIIE